MLARSLPQQTLPRLQFILPQTTGRGGLAPSTTASGPRWWPGRVRAALLASRRTELTRLSNTSAAAQNHPARQRRLVMTSCTRSRLHAAPPRLPSLSLPPPLPWVPSWAPRRLRCCGRGRRGPHCGRARRCGTACSAPPHCAPPHRAPPAPPPARPPALALRPPALALWAPGAAAPPGLAACAVCPAAPSWTGTCPPHLRTAAGSCGAAAR
mmetsp:Transcript_55928/g.159197  ORF Transcript_55928/g.159197 Transcript_55928/m.159197 type:complete len:211 (+) Transcript_55928:270-902(+)